MFDWLRKLFTNGEASSSRSGGASEYRSLLRKTRGDKAQAARLIEYEQRRHPQWTRARLIQAALESWDRSNH